MPSARIGGKCPICGADVKKKTGQLNLPTCEKGHVLIDPDTHKAGKELGHGG